MSLRVILLSIVIAAAFAVPCARAEEERESRIVVSGREAGGYGQPQWGGAKSRFGYDEALRSLAFGGLRRIAFRK